jgi:hypothetical protein
MAEQDITKTGPVGLKGLKGISAKEEQDIQRALQYSRAVRASEATGNVGWENATDAALFSPQHRELDDPLASWGTSKYDTLNTGLDDYDAMNEGRYQNQSTLDALGNALAKMLGTAATTIVSGIANIPVGIYTAIDEGRWSGLWDNELTRGLSEVEDFMEDNFKIYQSKEQQNAPWLSLTNLTSASFWGDDVIKNVGFMLGAAASGSIFTGGLGLAAKALNLVSNATKTSKIGTAILGSMFSAAGEGAIEAKQTMESLVDLNNQRLDDTLDRQREEAYARYRETGDIMTYQSTLNDIEAKRIAGKQQILQDARSAGNIDMALNMPILTLGNFFTLGKGFSKSFSNARKMAEASAKSGGADLLNGISDIKNKARKMFQEARTGELKTQLEHTLKNAKWQKTKAFFKPILSEGSEEMNQQWASSLSGYAYDREDPNDYWRARMNPGSQQETMSALTAIGKGFLDSWGDYDQWEQFFVGGLTGAIGMPMPTKAFNQDKTKRKYDPRRYFSWEGGSFQNLREMKEKIDAATKLNEALNTRYKDPKFWNRFDSAVAHSYFQTDMDEGVANDDIKQYKDAEEKQFVQDLDLAVRSGTVDDFLTFIDASTQNLTDEDIDNIVSRNTVTITKEQDTENQKNTLKRRVASLQQIAEKAIEEGKEAEATEALNQIGEIMGEFNNVVGEEKKIGLFVDSHGNRVKSNDEIRKELESNGKKLKDRVNEYLKSVQYVNSVSGGKLTSDQEGNLAYLHYLGKAARKRANNIMDKAILPLSFTITLDKGETVESLQKTLGNGVSITPNGDNTVTIETSNTNEHWRDVILDIALGHDKESTKKNVDELINRNLGFENDILDAISLLNDSREFGITFAKYMKEPGRVDEARKKAEQESQQEVENSNVDNKSVQELVEDSDNGKVDLDASEFDFTSEDLTDAEQENLDPERKKEIDRKQKVNTARDIKKTRDTAKEKAKERVIDDDILSSIDAMLDRATSSAEVASDIIDLDTEAFNDPDSLLPTVDEQQLLSVMNDPNSTPEDIEKAKKAYNESRQQRLDEIKNVLSEITKEVVEDLERLKNLPEKGNGAPEVVRTLDSTKSKDPVEAPPTVNKEGNTKEEKDTGEEVETPTPNTTNIDLVAASQNTQISDTQMQDKSYWKSGTTEYPIHRNTENNDPYYEQVKDKKKQAILKTIYDFLRTSGVFTRIRNNEIKVGQKVRFAISKSLSDKIYANSKERVPVLLVVNEDGNILFDLPNPSDTATFGSYTGLAEFYNEVITYYNENREKVDGDLVIYPNAESTISRPYIGRPLYSAKNERSTLNEIAHGVPFKLGIALTSSPDAKMIMTPGRRRSQGRTEDDQSIVSPESALAGQPYLLIETSDPRRRWVPVPFTMPTFSSDVASSSLYKIIVAHLQKLNDPKSLLTEEAQKEWKRGLKDLLAVSDIFLDVKEVGNNYQVNFRVKVSSTDTAWSTIYRGTVIQNEDISTDIVKALGGLNIPFQISRKYINTQFNGQDYNSLIGELATTNLEKWTLHTVNDFYTIDPIIKGKKEGAKSIQDAPKEAEDEVKASRERNFVRSTIIPDQSNIDRNRTDSNYYYIKESDGKYHKYQRVHNVLPSNSNNTGTANSQRALRTGSAVDTIVRDFFNTGKTTKPDFMSDKAYNSIIEYLKSLDKWLNDHKWSVFANNIVLYQKYLDGRRIAGEVDLLFIDNKGNYYIYDVKTSVGPFAGFRYEGVNSAWGQTMSTKEYHTYQVSSYAKLLYDRFGKKTEGVAIVPFTIVYGNDDTVIGVNKVPNIALPIIDVDNYFKKATPQPSEQSTQAEENKPDTSEPRQDVASIRETLKKKAVFKPKKWQARIDRLNDDNIQGLSKLKTPILKTLAQYLDAKIIPNMSDEELNNLVAEQLRPKNREVSTSNLTKEEQSILDKAPRDFQGRLLAPNSRPSNLTPKQYAQVRTKAFKKWFGNWERVARSSRFRESQDIPNSITSATYQGVTVSEALFDADMAPDGGKRVIFLGDKYIGEIPVIETKDKIRMGGSIGAATEIEEEYRGKGYGKKAHLALANIAKSEGKILYSDRSNSDAEDALWKSLVKDGIAEVVSEKPKVGHWNHTTYRILNDKLPQADDINSGDRNVSKVVDENGEPLVVYHSTRADFSTFDLNKSKRGEGLWFKPWRDNSTIVGKIVEKLSQSHDIPVYLNIKNPVIVDKPSGYKSGDIYTRKGIDKHSTSNNDGAIGFSNMNVFRSAFNMNDIRGKNGVELVVFNPNQIKSATDNIGTFSRTDNDIRYRKYIGESESLIGRELEVIGELLPQLSEEDRIRIVGTLIKIPGGKAWGQFKDGAITLYKNAARGTAYHEAFHFVFNTLMTDQELENAFKSAKRQWGNLSPIELEERMAEDFRRYMQNEETFVGRLKNLWSRLKALLNHFNSNWFYLDRVYTDILKGKYIDRDVNTEAIDTIEIKQYHEIKLSYNKLSKEQKDYLSERKISPKEYSNMTILEKEILFHCMY